MMFMEISPRFELLVHRHLIGEKVVEEKTRICVDAMATARRRSSLLVTRTRSIMALGYLINWILLTFLSTKTAHVMTPKTRTNINEEGRSAVIGGGERNEGG